MEKLSNFCIFSYSNLKYNKRKAKLLLKKKRYYENNITKTDQSLDNLDQMISTLEYTQIEHKVVECLKIGNESLKNLHQMLSIDQIEDIMEDTREAIEHQRVKIYLDFFFKF